MKKNFGIVSFLILVLTLTACGAETDSRRMGNDGDVTMYDSILDRIDSKQNNTSGFI
ncbi:hypothetical protein NXH76_28460 [Blautia schinkii]|nr:hypothetical protein [Blautia schinkii]